LKTHSGNIYKVKRRELNYEDDMKNYLNFTESNTEIKLDEEEKNEFSIKNVIELYFRNTEPGEEFFDKKIKDLETSINLQFPSILNDEKLKEINNISKKNFVEIKINPKNDGAILIGLTDSISAARQEILEYLVNNLASTNKFTFPSTWEPQTANCELKSISPNSSEWQQIELRMKETLPNIRISKLERVQNKWLWEKYQSSKAILEKKNQGNVNEKQLFHGTRANQPNNIFNDEYGFDMRFSSGGMWGVAIYFAQNASYSNSYRYTTPDNQYQMFFARVLVGDCIHIMPNDSSLKKPPSKQTVSGLGFTENYDSVSGETGGSKVYMIYENGRAYPEYLITYQ